MQKSYLRIKGEKIALFTFRKDSEAIDKYNEWFNDEDANASIGYNNRVVHTKKSDIKDITDWLGDSEYTFNIGINHEKLVVGNNDLMGVCSIVKEDYRDNALLNIFVYNKFVGDGDNKDIYKDVIKTLTKYCFEELGIKNIAVKLNESDTQAVECYKEIGFKICGRELEAFIHKGKYCNILTLQMLADEYKS